jgi:hypothetical protein
LTERIDFAIAQDDDLSDESLDGNAESRICSGLSVCARHPD